MRITLSETKSVQTGCGQDDRVDFTLFTLAQPSVDVTSERHEREVGAYTLQLNGAAQRRRTDARPSRQLFEPLAVTRLDHIASVLAFGDARQTQPRRQLGWDVFERMYGEVSAAFE